jgi:hypothetical protein
LVVFLVWKFECGSVIAAPIVLTIAFGLLTIG